MREQPLRTAALVLAVVVAVAFGIAIDHTTLQTTSTPAVETVNGVPLETQDTPGGALAAADNDVAIGSQTVEQDPARFARLVHVAYTPGIRGHTLAQAAALRRADPADMRNYAAGGRAIAVIAARRLDSFSPRRARVTSWLGGLVWGPHLSPRQSWNLVDTTLAYDHGNWLLRASSAQRTPAPVPSIVYVEGHNNRSQVFDERLAGMSAPFYGSG
jgi:hypothetical protein